MARKTFQESKVAAREYREERGEDTMSAGMYLFVMSAGAAVALVVSIIAGSYTWKMVPGPWLYLGIGLGWMVFVLACGMFNVMSENPVANAFWLMLIAAATGAFIGPVAGLFTPNSLANILFYTVAITLIMGLLGAFWPTSLYGFGEYLMKALGALVFVSFGLLVYLYIMIFFGLRPALPFQLVLGLDLIGILIFMGLVMYETWEALRMPKNASNALINSVNLYLNMANIAIRIASWIGVKAVEVAPDVGEGAAAVAGAVFEG